MTAAAPKRQPPVIGQLRDGRWAVFNLPGTPLWEMTFKTREQAEDSLYLWERGERLEREAMP